MTISSNEGKYHKYYNFIMKNVEYFIILCGLCKNLQPLNHIVSIKFIKYSYEIYNKHNKSLVPINQYNLNIWSGDYGDGIVFDLFGVVLVIP